MDDDFTVGTGYFKTKKPESIWITVGIIVLVALSYWFYKDQPYNTTLGMVYPTIIVLFVFVWKTGSYYLAKYSLKMIFAPYYSTYDGKVKKIPGTRYAAARVGGISVPYWPNEPGKDGTIIYPRAAHNEGAECLIPNASFKPIPPNELNKPVREYLEQHGYPRPYLIGYAPSESYTKNPELEAIIEELQQSNSLNAFYESQLKLRPDATESMARFGRRIAGAAKGGGFKEALKKAQGSSEE